MNYIYDGTYNGFLSCVFECFEYKDDVQNLLVEGDDSAQVNMFNENKNIVTDILKTKRVQVGLHKKIGHRSTKDFYRVFLSEDYNARLAAFKIIRKLFLAESNILQNYGDNDVLYFFQILKKVSRESHRMKAFVRFSKSSDGLYFAIIEPDFDVLPLIIDFFKNRFTDQKWMIYDIKRKYGFLYENSSVMEVRLTAEEKHTLSTDAVIMLDEQDEHFQQLWKRYYQSTNIEARRNMKLHLQHVPKRYWKYLVEKQ